MKRILKGTIYAVILFSILISTLGLGPGGLEDPPSASTTTTISSTAC